MKVIFIILFSVASLFGCSQNNSISDNCVEQTKDFHGNMSELRDLAKAQDIEASSSEIAHIAAEGKMVLVFDQASTSIACLRINDMLELEYLFQDGNGLVLDDWQTVKESNEKHWGE